MLNELNLLRKIANYVKLFEKLSSSADYVTTRAQSLAAGMPTAEAFSIRPRCRRDHL